MLEVRVMTPSWHIEWTASHVILNIVIQKFRVCQNVIVDLLLRAAHSFGLRATRMLET